MCIRGIVTKMFWEREEFPWLRDIEEMCPIVREELIGLWKVKGGRGDGNELLKTMSSWGTVGSVHASHDAELVASGGGSSAGGGTPSPPRWPEWREYVLLGSDAEPDAAVRAPRTMDALRQLVPGAVDMARRGLGEVIFSVLAPGTRLMPHCASTNARLTCHLGLVVPSATAAEGGGSSPQRCRIRVGDKWREWEEGKCLFFDDSFEHEVEQYGSAPRAVLLIRFWHPGIPPERWEDEMQKGAAMFDEFQARRQYPPMEGEQKKMFDALVSGSGRRAVGLEGVMRDGSMEM